MKIFLLLSGITLSAACSVSAHTWSAGESTAERETLRAHILADWQAAHAEQKRMPVRTAIQTAAIGSSLQLAAAAIASEAKAPQSARAFLPFTRLDLRADDQFLYIGSNGIPDHSMMVGITTWQQQVPLPQSYFGDNAWRIPLHPVPAKVPAMIKGRFLRGAIALAVNGIPIFNPQNNRGEIASEIGELDQWGGHCGRADDYHYHLVPLHLQVIAGKGMPVAYALDGYPIYGLTEPDGSVVGQLDECHGHELPGMGYHYHASKKYPYVMGGFHGVVVESGDQVEPQPRAQPVRDALQPLRGATITTFEKHAAETFKLGYTVNGDLRSVAWRKDADGSYAFMYDNGKDGRDQKVYTARQGGGGGEAKGKGKGKGRGKGGPAASNNTTEPQEGASPDQPRTSNGTFMLSSPVVDDGGEIPAEYTGDGSGATPPLVWQGQPAGTKGYALIMDHTDNDGRKKWYWTLYDLPSSLVSLLKNTQGIGKTGTGFRGHVGYEPPHSRGPGAKTYVLTLYALGSPLNLNLSPKDVNREVLLEAMRGKVLATSSLRIVHTRAGTTTPE